MIDSRVSPGLTEDTRHRPSQRTPNGKHRTDGTAGCAGSSGSDVMAERDDTPDADVARIGAWGRPWSGPAQLDWHYCPLECQWREGLCPLCDCCWQSASLGGRAPRSKPVDNPNG